MRAALLTEIGRAPEPADLPAPTPGAGETLLEVLAASLNPIDIAIGAGRFYGGHPPLPYVPGVEVVGRILASAAHPVGALAWGGLDGLGLRRHGGLAEQAVVQDAHVVTIPDGVDPALAAALGVAGMAGWLPPSWRAPVRRGESVLVLGATGAVGLVAVQAARILGAGRVVAAGRRDAGLQEARARGADATVRLDASPDLAQAFREACGGSGPDLIVDPLWGPPLVAALEAAATGARVVNLGQSAGAEAMIRSAVVRGKQLEILGFSDFAVPPAVWAAEYRRLIGYAAEGRITLPIERFPLDRVTDAWQRQAAGADRKLVLVP